MVAQARGELQVDPFATGLAQADRGAGGRHVRYFVRRVLAPHRDARVGADGRGELDAQLLAGVDRGPEGLLAGGEVSRCGGTGQYLEGPAPVGIDVEDRSDRVDHAQLGLPDGAVALQRRGDATGQVGAAGKAVHTVGRHDLQRGGGLIHGLRIGTEVVQGVAVVVLDPRRGGEVGRDGVAVAQPAVRIVLMLGVESALDRQRRRGGPGHRAEQAGLFLIPLTTLARRVAGHVRGEGHLPVVLVTVVVQLVADMHDIAELQIQMGAEMAHVAVVDVVGILERGSATIGCQLSGGHEAGLVGFVVVHARDQTEIEQVIVAAVEPLAAQRVFLRSVMIAVAVGRLRRQKIVLRDTVGVATDRHLRFAGVVAAIGEPRIGIRAALAGAEVDVAPDVVQAIARVVGTPHDFDVVDVQREHHVDEALVATVDVAGNAIDQDLDPVEVALAIECTEGRLAGLRALAGFGQLHARHLAE